MQKSQPSKAETSSFYALSPKIQATHRTNRTPAIRQRNLTGTCCTALSALLRLSSSKTVSIPQFCEHSQSYRPQGIQVSNDEFSRNAEGGAVASHIRLTFRTRRS